MLIFRLYFSDTYHVIEHFEIKINKLFVLSPGAEKYSARTFSALKSVPDTK